MTTTSQNFNPLSWDQVGQQMVTNNGTVVQVVTINPTTVLLSAGGAVIGQGKVYTYSTNVQVTAPADTNNDALLTLTMPVQYMGANGRLEIEFLVQHTNNANSKTYTLTLGGQNIVAVATSGNTGYSYKAIIYNQAATGSQFIPRVDNGYGAMNAQFTTTVDTTVPQTFVLSAQKAVAGDTITLTGFMYRITNG